MPGRLPDSHLLERRDAGKTFVEIEGANSQRSQQQHLPQVGHSPKLRQIAAVCGRFTRIALQRQKTRVKHPPDEITSITTGSEIERLLPSEIALLADPDLEDLFYLRFAERGLMQYDLIGHEPQGQGPIIIAIDESGSMTTDYGVLIPSHFIRFPGRYSQRIAIIGSTFVARRAGR